LKRYVQTDIITEENAWMFKKKLDGCIQHFQQSGYEVEVQFATGGYKYHALVLVFASDPPTGMHGS